MADRKPRDNPVSTEIVTFEPNKDLFSRPDADKGWDKLVPRRFFHDGRLLRHCARLLTSAGGNGFFPIHKDMIGPDENSGIPLANHTDYHLYAFSTFHALHCLSKSLHMPMTLFHAFAQIPDRTGRKPAKRHRQRS